jgi:hypothetical protein
VNLKTCQAAAIGVLLGVIIVLGLADLAAWALTGLPILVVW